MKLAIIISLAALVCLAAATGALAAPTPSFDGTSDPTTQGAVYNGNAAFGSLDTDTSSWRINDTSTSQWLYYAWDISGFDLSEWTFSITLQAGLANAQDDTTAFAVLDGKEWHFNYYVWSDQGQNHAALFYRDASALDDAPNSVLFTVDNPTEFHTFMIGKSGTSANVYCDGVLRTTIDSANLEDVGNDRIVAFGSPEGNGSLGDGYGMADSRYKEMLFSAPVAAVPEPTGMLALMTGIIAICGLAYRRRK